MVATPALETPVFTIGPGTLTREGAGSRTLFWFTAPATRHLDGGFEFNNVNALLFDKAGRFVARRSSERARTVLGNRATWLHELPNDQLAGATRLVYQVEYRFDLRRKIVAGELPPLPVEADGSDYWRWLDLDPRLLEDRVVRFDFGLWARSSSIDITIGQHPKLATDSMRTEFELDLLDQDRALVAGRSFSNNLNNGQPYYDDHGLSIERKALRGLRFFELRGRTESRGVAELAIDTLP